jgi:hypothetical protein
MHEEEFLMKPAEDLGRVHEIVNELKEAIARMSAPLTPDIEPAIAFSLEEPDTSETASNHAERSE